MKHATTARGYNYTPGLIAYTAEFAGRPGKHNTCCDADGGGPASYNAYEFSRKSHGDNHGNIWLANHYRISGPAVHHSISPSNGGSNGTIGNTSISGLFPREMPGGPSDSGSFRPLLEHEYIVIALLPVLLTVPLSVMLRAINTEVKSLLPFRALTRRGGASAADSVCMETGALYGLANSLRLLLRFKEPSLRWEIFWPSLPRF